MALTVMLYSGALLLKQQTSAGVYSGEDGDVPLSIEKCQGVRMFDKW